MPYCICSAKPLGRFLRMTARTLVIAARRSSGSAARYSAAVVARLVMGPFYEIPQAAVYRAVVTARVNITASCALGFKALERGPDLLHVGQTITRMGLARG